MKDSETVAKRWAMAAIGGMLAGVGACGGTPEAATAAPVMVPTAAAAEKHHCAATAAGEKHHCASTPDGKHACGAPAPTQKATPTPPAAP